MATIINPTRFWRGVKTETADHHDTALPDEVAVSKMTLDDITSELRATLNTLVTMEAEYARWCEYRETLQAAVVSRMQGLGIKAEVIKRES